MASVMRVMGLGGMSGASRQLKENQPAADSWGEDLSRQSSRLNPPNPAYQFGSPSGGILLNAQRPPSPYSVSDVDPLSQQHPRRGSASCGSTPYGSPPTTPGTSAADPGFHPLGHAHTADEATTRGRSVHRALMSPPTSPNSGSATPTSPNTRIRFAPLPLIRPRAYSTGRSVFLSEPNDVAEGHPGDGAERQWVRRDREEDFILDDDHQLDLSDSDDDDTGKGIFGSWGGSGSSFGGRKDDSKSSKLLRPFGLGRKKSSKRSPSADSRASDRSLARTESRDSDSSHALSRISSNASGTVPFKSSGVPLRKASTWEPGEKREPPRRAYPSVAQRSKRHSTTTRGAVDMAALRPDPTFSEWGSTASVGSVGASGAQDDDGDDGSGMAWIKKRRAQREAAERQAKEEADAAKLDKSQDDKAAGSPAAESTSKMATPTTSGTSTPTVAGAATPVTLNKPTLPTLVTSPASPMPGSPVNGQQFQFDDDSSAPKSATTSIDESERSVQTKRSSSSTDPTSDEEEDDDDDDDDDDDEDGEKEEDDDDLDAEELAKEEALAAAAKEKDTGAGKERFHSADHQNKMMAVAPAESNASHKKRTVS